MDVFNLNHYFYDAEIEVINAWRYFMKNMFTNVALWLWKPLILQNMFK